jgi:hypoxanthine phosphoribosyltransferase
MNIFILRQVFQDTVSDHTRIRVTPEEISVLCELLAQNIKDAPYTPDLIIAIDTGGSFPGELLAKALETTIEHITIRRDIHIGRMYKNDPIPLRWLMSLYHHYLFHTTKPTLLQETLAVIEGKRILVVDDSLHTGITLEVALEYLRDKGASEIRTATLAHVMDKLPDYSILKKGNYSFPWSKDYIAT